ncbi:MAG: flagellar hook-basal body complex protein FliE [Pirellulales bacterium]
MTPISSTFGPMLAKTSLGGVAAAPKPTSSFKDVLLESIQEVNRMQADADSAVERLATGDDVNPAEVLTAVQKADLAFRMMMQVRNKLFEAYQEFKDIRV